MSLAASPAAFLQIDEQLARAVRTGLGSSPRTLPPWLFYDEAGSELFEQITELPEYYLTRTERAILERHASEMVAMAARGSRLRFTELGAGSAEKTRVLMKAALARQEGLVFEAVDVSATALLVAQARIEREIPGVRAALLEMDYTNGFELDACEADERRLVLYIGSSIGNFEPEEAARILRKVRKQLDPGDGLLLGVDLVKDEATLIAAYDDAAGVTAAFNKNMLVRMNRELGADFDLERFSHRAAWNDTMSRMEMHLESCADQRVRFASLDWEVEFGAGETIHTENSYKYRPGDAEAMLAAAGFASAGTWTDERGWFEVCLGRAA
ncbi:MAG: L-histidine N(alpha)-methyltransferase [Terracidiphilus sp.]